MFKDYSRLALVALFGVALVTCESDPNAADGDPQIIGTIAEVDTSASSYTMLLVGDLVIPDIPPPTPADSALAGQLFLQVPTGTPVFVVTRDGSMVHGDAEDLSAGSPIRAWHVGPVKLSLVPIYTATRVEVTESE